MISAIFVKGKFIKRLFSFKLMRKLCLNCQMSSEDTLLLDIQIGKALQILCDICNFEMIVLYNIIYGLYLK